MTLLSYFFIAQTTIKTKHTHFFANGVVITHSHPLQSEEEGSSATHHHHSKSEICFFNNLQFHSYNTVAPLLVKLAIVEVHIEFYIADETLVHIPDFLKIELRGPPLA